MCTLYYGAECHSQGCNGAMTGILWFFWHPKHCFINFMMSLSIPGHQTELWANVFILTAPLWLSCNIFKMCLRSLMGTMTRMPQNKHPWYKVVSFLGLYNGLSITYVSVSFKPFLTWSCILASTLSHDSPSEWHHLWRVSVQSVEHILAVNGILPVRFS